MVDFSGKSEQCLTNNKGKVLGKKKNISPTESDVNEVLRNNMLLQLLLISLIIGSFLSSLIDFSIFMLVYKTRF